MNTNTSAIPSFLTNITLYILAFWLALLFSSVALSAEIDANSLIVSEKTETESTVSYEKNDIPGTAYDLLRSIKEFATTGIAKHLVLYYWIYVFLTFGVIFFILCTLNTIKGKTKVRNVLNYLFPGIYTDISLCWSSAKYFLLVF